MKTRYEKVSFLSFSKPSYSELSFPAAIPRAGEVSPWPSSDQEFNNPEESLDQWRGLNLYSEKGCFLGPQSSEPFLEGEHSLGENLENMIFFPVIF